MSKIMKMIDERKTKKKQKKQKQKAMTENNKRGQKL